MRDHESNRPRRQFEDYQSGSGFRSGMLVLVACVLGLLWAEVRADALPTPAPTPSTAMSMDWVDDFLDDLDDVVDDLEEAANETSTEAATNVARLEKYLDRAVRNIEDILAPEIYPSLDEGVTGEIITTINPETLADYAEETITLALDAAAEIEAGGEFDQELVASKLKTIVHLIERTVPHGYKTRAGV